MKKVITILLFVISFIVVLCVTSYAIGTSILFFNNTGNDIENEFTISGNNLDVIRISNSFTLNKGEITIGSDSITESDSYACITNYFLRNGHTLSISGTNLVFSVYKYEDGVYTTILKEASSANYQANEDLVVGLLISNLDGSPLTENDISNTKITDYVYNMNGVSGYFHYFTVEADKIDGGTQTTRCAVFLPDSYSKDGTPTTLIMYSHGYSAHLNEKVWYSNLSENPKLVKNYLNEGYALLLVDNTSGTTQKTADIGCPQLVSSFKKAYKYLIDNFNISEKFILHSLSYGTYAGIRLLREMSDKIICAAVTGPRISVEDVFENVNNRAHIANRFGFDDQTGNTYEPDKIVGYDIYVDIDNDFPTLPPTFWVLAEGDETDKPYEVIEKLENQNQNIRQKTYNTSHWAVCQLSYEQALNDVLAYYREMTFTPKSYLWETNGEDLVSVNENGEALNTLNKVGGTITNGTYNNAVYGLNTPVLLYSRLPWVIEWKCSGDFVGDIFAMYNQLVEGQVYLFRSTVGTGFLGFGTYTGGQYHNYGTIVDINDTEKHIYRIENRIKENGNEVVLLIDGCVFDTLDNYYIKSTDNQNQRVNWAGEKDFVFHSIGATSSPLNRCGLDYIKVYEDISLDSSSTINMKYDDRLDISDKTIEVLDSGTPQSYKVGYGIVDEILDDSVIKIENNTLIASGIGKAYLLIDGKYTCIVVEPAPISLLLLIGQSNMQGSEGDENQSIVCPDGVVYATYGDRYTMTTKNAKKYAPSALTGELSSINVTGNTEYLSSYPVYSLNDKGAGKPGPDSGIAYSWVKESGEKVWVVNAAHGGSSITTWQKTGDNYKEAVLLFSSCEETLRQEIKSGHYTLSHMGYFWLQGCTDEKQSAQWYYDRFIAMHENLKNDLSFDHDSNPDTPNITFEFADIMLAMAGHSGASYSGYRAGVYEDKSSTFYSTFLELEMRGHRVAQHYLAASQEYPDINMVCTIGESWLTMPDGTSGVKAYFEEHYEGGIVDYTVQVKQKDSWYKPTKALDVKDTIHYNQIGYNEIGIEAARNALILLGVKEDTNIETKVEFVNWTGYKEVNEIQGCTIGNSGTLVVPIVTPCYRAKEVTYTCSDGLSYNLYDLLTNDITKGGTLTASTGDYVEVVPSEPYTYLWRDNGTGLSSKSENGEKTNNLTKKAGTVNDGLYSNISYSLTTPVKLIHNLPWVVEWKCAGLFTGMLFSSTGQTGVGQEYLFKTTSNSGLFGFGTYNGSQFLNYGAIYNISDNEYHIYRMENRVNSDGSNMAYFYVDDIEIGPMNNFYIAGTNNQNMEVDWVNGHDFVFSYIGTTNHPINNCKIKYIAVFEDGSGKDIHIHDFNEWETVQLPTEHLSGIDSRTCLDCGYNETRTYDGVYQICDLGNHINILPKSMCKGKNIWTMFEHDPYYYAYGTHWGIHSSGKVFSITININPGDKIYATSFGKSNENGSNGVANGIRLTFFDIYGVLVSYEPSQVYSEFSKNGYITAPKGAYAVCVAMWTNSNDNEFYILSYDHNFDNGTITKEATCTDIGELTYTCHLCGETQTENIESLGHNYSSVITNPTCTEQGFTTYLCSRCTDSYVDTYVDALGHTYSDVWTYDDIKAHSRICTRCNDAKLSEDHIWGVGIIKRTPTYTKYGEIEFTCSVCSNTKIEYIRINVDIPGDFNGDGKINNKDLFRMFRYLSDVDEIADKNILDLNTDGKVNNKDLFTLLRFVSGLDAELPFMNLDMYEIKNILKDDEISLPNGIIFECDNLQYITRNNNFIYFKKDSIDYSGYTSHVCSSNVIIYYECETSEIENMLNELKNNMS